MTPTTIINRAVAIARLCQRAVEGSLNNDNAAILDARIELAWRTVRRWRRLT